MSLVAWLREWARQLPRKLLTGAGDVTGAGDAAAYEALAELLPPFVQTPIPPDVFIQWERSGFHLTPNHFYSPIPEVGSLPETLWRPKDHAAGIDFNDGLALELLTKNFPRFREEYTRLPRRADAQRTRFHFDNSQFSGTDALVLYCIVRHFRPARIVEIGGGYSSLLSGEALSLNGGGELLCVEPHPPPWLRKALSGQKRLIERPVQQVHLDLFTSLKENDILFIDGSHVAKTGSDVLFLFLEVLPRLHPGVIIQVHDIFLPDEYPRGWLTDLHYFWNEQYLLHAFLIGNTGVEVLFGNTYMERRYPEEMRQTFPDSPWWGGGSFWFRTRRSPKQ